MLGGQAVVKVALDHVSTQAQKYKKLTKPLVLLKIDDDPEAEKIIEATKISNLISYDLDLFIR